MMSIHFALAVALLAPAAAVFIRPSNGPTVPHWLDTEGNRIEAHAAGMLFDNNTQKWYWYGESKKTSDLASHGITCYSAESFAGPWTFEGTIITQSDVRASISGPYIIERPKVIYNSRTQMYVLWFHLDDAGYKFRHAAVATSSAPNKGFKFVSAFQPDGIPSLDMSLWKDEQTQDAYFVRSCDNAYAGISRLTSDYMNTTGLISNHSRFEGMALFRLPNGTFYIITSHLTGWNPNPLMLFRAAGSSLDDPQWVDMGNPTGSSTSFNSQPTYVVSAVDKHGSPYYVYMGDNWVHGGPGGLIDASYMWLPFRFAADNVTLEYVWEWDPEDPFAAPPTPPAANGTRVQFVTCTGADVQQWTLTPDQQGPIQLKSNASLCLDTVGVDANSGKDALGLAQCSGSQSQRFTYHSSSQEIVDSNGVCVDVTFCDNTVCEGAYVERYACGSPHHNQQYTFQNGDIIPMFDQSLCLTPAPE